MPAALTSVTPFKGRAAEVSAALEAAIGIGCPGVGRAIEATGNQAVWAGLNETLVLGQPVVVDGAAAVDQSDGWSVLSLEGARAAEVLARLTPLDMRPTCFGPGSAARSLLGHMTCLFVCVAPERYDLLLFRSMAGTAVHELSGAMQSVAAQNARQESDAR